MGKPELLPLLVLCAAVSQAKSCFHLITPSKWGAQPANCSAPLQHILAESVVLIHTGTNKCNSTASCSDEVRSIQYFHQRVKGWCDIAYSFLIGEDGRVYEGRGWRTEGAHTYGYNDLALGIAFIGDFTERIPNEAAWKALKCLLKFSVKVGYLDPNYLLIAHSDVSNLSSPGEPVRKVISKWPNYKGS